MSSLPGLLSTRRAAIEQDRRKQLAFQMLFSPYSDFSNSDFCWFSSYRGGTGEPRIFLGAAVSHLEGTKTNQRAAVWESTGPPPWLRGGIWLYPDEHNQF